MERINEETCELKLKDGISVVGILEEGCQSSEAMKMAILKVKDKFPAIQCFEAEGCENCEFVVENMITSIPSMLVFKNGKLENKISGHHSDKMIFNAIEKVVNNS